MGRYEIWTIVVLCYVGAIRSQENARKNISPSLIECYDNALNGKYNLLPHTMDTFIAIIRKIEQIPSPRMDLRQLSTAILHRFRQDGIELNPEVRPQAGIMPYAPLGKQFYRHAQTLRIVPGSAVNFPNDSISALERCTLHSMLSSSIDKYTHPGENRGCRSGNYASGGYNFRRWRRSAQGPKDDVETLSPEQVEMLMSKDQVDPNSKYPAFPPNHPSASARITEDQLSECPIESGVLKTPWGPVSAGSVLAGIAAGMEPQSIKIGDLIKQQVEPRVFSGLPTDANLDNKFLATLAGDLAEVALAQGPQSPGRFVVGADGSWNSTARPLYYFLGTKDNLQMTGAEIRGDLDGLILANLAPEYYRRFGQLRLSQVLDMYYSDRGVFDPKNRACNRRSHLPTVAPTEVLKAQTRSSAIVLSSVGYATVTISPERIETFSDQAVRDFSDFVPTMNSDNQCEFTNSAYARATSASSNSRPAVNLTIIIDTNWPFEEVQQILAQMLSGLSINEYSSGFRIINGFDGSIVVNHSDSILAFAEFNRSIYDRLPKGFSIAQSIQQLRELQTLQLDEEKSRGLAGGKSDVVVIMPHHGNMNPSDRDFVLKSFEDMRREVPDARVLFLAYGQKDGWAEVVEDSEDVISINFSGENIENNPAIDTILTRIKQVPRRLVNTQCGSNYDQTGNSRELENFVGPNEVNFYRMHANYFMSGDSDKPKLKIQSYGSPLKICWSRELLHVNASAARMAATCNSNIVSTQIIELDCEGASYIRQCKPYYLSIESNSNSSIRFDCTDPTKCQFPDDIKYRISFERLVCKSGASALLVAPLLLLATLARLFI